MNTRDRRNYGRTPLMEAVGQNDLETVKLIRKAGEDQKIQIDLFERDDEGASAFDLAESNPAIQEYLEAWASHWAENVLREGDASPDTISGFDGWEDSDDVAIPGTVWLIAETDPEFKGEDFERKVTDVTWKQLADEIIPAIIATTGNDRHVFLEELQKIKYEVEPGVPSYYVDMVDMIS